eukprot:GHVN01054968.1.p1 GENE.GHVN01054968.1~~GHVN01054968.1.p1  ORF type:complete len:561 (-),score=87.19 GHVN01054968.1:921-2603(-)
MATLPEYLWIVIIGGIFAFVMGFATGGNDMANQFGSSIGSGSIKLWQAIILGLVCEFIGAVLLGASVSSTIRKGIIDPDYFLDRPELLMYGNMCALISSSIILVVVTWLGIPVSTTQTLVAALIGFALASGRSDSINMKTMAGVFLSWLFSPLCAAFLAFIIFAFIRYFILRAEDPMKAVIWFMLPLLWLVTSSLSLYVMFKNPLVLKNVSCVQYNSSSEVNESSSPCHVKKWMNANLGLGIAIGLGMGTVISLMLGAIMLFIVKKKLKRDSEKPTDAERHVSQVSALSDDINAVSGEMTPTDEANLEAGKRAPQKEESEMLETTEASEVSKVGMVKSLWRKAPWFKDLHEEAFIEDPRALIIHSDAEMYDERVEWVFGYLQIVSACFAMIAHGASDLANSVGPMSAILAAYTTGAIDDEYEVPVWLLFYGAIAMCTGLAFFGSQVTKSLGIKMTKISPSRGLSIELSTAWVVLIFANLGVPLNGSHSQVGATVAIGLMEKKSEGELSDCKHGLCLNLKQINLWLFGKIMIWALVSFIASMALCEAIYSFGAYAPTQIGE